MQTPHHTISDLYRTLGLPLDEDIAFTSLSIPEIHTEIPFTSSDLRADYFSFILTLDGSGIYYLDEHAFPFGPGSLYFTNPGHLKSYALHASKEAYIIMLTETFLRDNVHPDIYSEFPFLLAEIIPPQDLSEELISEFQTLFDQITKASNSTSVFKERILGNLMLVFLFKLKEHFWLHYDPLEEGSGNSQIVRSFKLLLETELKNAVNGELEEPRLQAQDFAEKLHLHPNYLNAVIKSKTGKTVNSWITKRTLAAARQLLANTSLSSKEIAQRLGFSAATHFARFFKTQTGMTPGAFRKG